MSKNQMVLSKEEEGVFFRSFMYGGMLKSVYRTNSNGAEHKENPVRLDEVPTEKLQQFISSLDAKVDQHNKDVQDYFEKRKQGNTRTFVVLDEFYLLEIHLTKERVLKEIKRRQLQETE